MIISGTIILTAFVLYILCLQSPRMFLSHGLYHHMGAILASHSWFTLGTILDLSILCLLPLKIFLSFVLYYHMGAIVVFPEPDPTDVLPASASEMGNAFQL